MRLKKAKDKNLLFKSAFASDGRVMKKKKVNLSRPLQTRAPDFELFAERVEKNELDSQAYQKLKEKNYDVLKSKLEKEVQENLRNRTNVDPE